MKLLGHATRRSALFAVGLAAIVWPAAAGADGGEVAGSITDADGKGLAGVMVTATEMDSGIAVTEFTDSDGRYALEGLRPGTYRVSARRLGFGAVAAHVGRLAGDGETLDLRLSRNPAFVRDLPSAHWMSLLPEGDMRREFLINCTSCHEIGHPRITKNERIRDEALWAEAIEMMRAIDVYGLTPPDFDDAKYAKWLTAHLTESAAAELTPPEPVSKTVAKARYTEYPVPKSPSLPHDLVVGPDRRIWVTAFFHDDMWALDPESGAVEIFHVNATPDTLAQVRAVEFDRKGRLWALLGGTEAAVRLDIETGAYETFDVGMYAHSLDLDSAGNIWVNDYFGKPERIGVVDVESGELETFDIPSANLSEAAGLPLPYGLQVSSDNVVWVTMIAANTLVGYDIESGKAKLYEMPTPNSGPRRPAIGPGGAVWIPEFAAGKLASVAAATETFTEYDLGSPTVGPYDVEVDQQSGIVWISGSLSSSIFRFDPANGEMREYPWPTEPGYIRHIAIDPETGDVWSAYSSLPAAKPKIVRLQTGE